LTTKPVRVGGRALRHEDGDELERGIDPENCSGTTVPSVPALVRGIWQAGRIEDDVHVADAPSHRSAAGPHDRLGEPVGDDAIDRLGLQQADTVELPAVEQHLTEADVVGN